MEITKNEITENARDRHVALDGYYVDLLSTMDNGLRVRPDISFVGYRVFDEAKRKKQTALSNEILGYVECSRCHKALGTKFINIQSELFQELIRIEGKVVSHGLCPDCLAETRREIFNECMM